ncbi:prepilin peptidase [Stenotrophomonas sp. HITSZ_GD]|uniref:A24 family peptidase n=1 Tax=Stenotrophomonas sp. HITSZ_GD TaxID=3037248 RepID=UPI00240E7BC4|nr:prepilin peptidase [Stenotrophomonas sp. HITSZ_GD]MDG2524444.1 prepilin peptidase [Stenotrophomonas sp. HITSZ_GD]
MDTAIALLTCALCVQVAVSDLYARRVSNRWLLTALALLAALLVAQGADAARWGHAALGLACAAILLPCYAIGWMGAGDVKFFAVLGALLGGAAPLLPVWIIASLLAGLHAMAVLAAPGVSARMPLGLRFALENTQARLQAWPPHQRMLAARRGRRGIPYATYLALAALLVVLQGGMAA